MLFFSFPFSSGPPSGILLLFHVLFYHVITLSIERIHLPLSLPPSLSLSPSIHVSRHVSCLATVRCTTTYQCVSLCLHLQVRAIHTRRHHHLSAPPPVGLTSAVRDLSTRPSPTAAFSPPGAATATAGPVAGRAFCMASTSQSNILS